MNANKDSIWVRAAFIKESALSGTKKAHLIVVEEMIEFCSPPGSNGETTFPQVMKRMLPSSAGTNIDVGAMAIGDSVVIVEGWKHANVYDVLELASVAFLQDFSTKEFYPD